MARKVTGWFEFGGVKSTDQNVIMTEFPTIARPPLREYDPSYVDGRDGALWGSDQDNYDPFEIKVQFRTSALTNMNNVSAWLSGSGWLRFSNTGTLAYKARVQKAFEYVRVIGSTSMSTVEVTFLVEPFKYVYPIPTYTLVQGGTLANPGTRSARPKITLTGSGDIVLTIGGQQLVILGLDGQIIIDCEAGVIYGGGVNLGHKIDREASQWPFSILPGNNVVTWTGTLTATSLQGNWVMF